MSHHNRHRTSRNTKPDNPLEFPDTGKIQSNLLDDISLEFPQIPTATTSKQSKPNVTIDFDNINTPVKHP